MAVQIILKNSTIEDKKPTPSQLTNGEISLNYNSAGAFLCCTDTDGNTQQVGGVKIDETAPDAPVKQSLWFKPSTLTLSVFDGDKWLPIAGGGGGGGGTPGGGDIVQIIGNDGIDADTVAGIVTLDVELAGGDDGLEFKTSKLSATLASATDLGSVKVGDNINVAAGKISVPIATDATLGVVKAGDGIDIESDGTISVDVPKTTTYRGSCDLNNDSAGQLNPDPPERGDAYINSADAAAIDPSWTPLTGSAKIGDLVIFDGTDWELIPLGAGSAPVTSVNTQTGDVVLTYSDVGAASEAQGDLADSALQPGDDISQLNNDAGYITASESLVTSVNTQTGDVVLTAADVGALAPGDDVSELVNDAGYITLAEVPPFPDQAPPVIISGTAPLPADSEPGDLWFNSNDGRTYVYYKDGDSSQWIDASPESSEPDILPDPGNPTPQPGTLDDRYVNVVGDNMSGNLTLGTDKITLDATDGTASFKAGAVNVDSSGRLLVGTPSSFGNNSVVIEGYSGSNAGQGIVTLARGSSTPADDNVLGTLEFTDSSHVAAANIAGRRDGGTWTSGSSHPTRLVFSTTADGATSLTERMTLDSSGDMAIGITGSFTPSTPAISLNADGHITAAGIISTSGSAASYSIIPSSSATLRLEDASGTAVQRTYNDGSVDLGGVINRGDPALHAPAITLLPDGNIVTVGDIQSTSQNGGQLAGFRNQIINGDFSIAQRGAGGASSVTRQYTCDRWYVHNDVAETYTWDQIDAPASFVAAGFDKALRVRNASNIFQVRQLVELPAPGKRGQFVEGSTWTASIYSNEALDCKVQWRDDSTGSPGAVTDIVSWTTMTQEGDRYTLTFTMPATAPQATALALGISFQRTDSTNGSLQVTGAQLEPGPVATPFEHRPIGTELALCQRYYQTVEHLALTMSQPANVTLRRLGCPRTVTMRAAPTESATTNAGTITFPNSSATSIGAFNSGALDGQQVLLTDYTADAEL